MKVSKFCDLQFLVFVCDLLLTLLFGKNRIFYLQKIHNSKLSLKSKEETTGHKEVDHSNSGRIKINPKTSYAEGNVTLSYSHLINLGPSFQQ